MKARTFPFMVNGERISVRASSIDKAREKVAQVWRDRQDGIVARRRNRETGTEILLVDRNIVDGGPEGDGNSDRWETICSEHGTVCSHETREVATAFMAEPTTWCEDCQAAYSTAGKGSWDDFAPEDS